ncbi:MAG: PEP-CTERM sorting domain-containing protein [Sedimentisphaerales bacterium]|nr:PEP-CTERM sorting domain-containing protein [Sedimentisphaerales bacterium]
MRGCAKGTVEYSGRREVRGRHWGSGAWLGPCAVLAAVACWSAPSWAAETSWTGAIGEWHEPSNWSGGVPGPALDASINNGGTAQVVYVSGVQNEASILYVGFQNTGAGTGSGYLDILTASGDAGQGYLSVSEAYLGYLGADSFGRVTSDGYMTYTGGGMGQSCLNVSGGLRVGYEGMGKVEVQNGGTVRSDWCSIGAEAGASGDVQVTGKGSTLWVVGSAGDLNVGVLGTGKLSFIDGGHSNSWAGTNIAAQPGSTGTLEIAHDVNDVSIWTSHTEWTGRVVVGGRYDEGLGQPVASGQGELVIRNNPALPENHAALHCIVQSPWSGGTVWATSGGTITLVDGGEINTVGNDVTDRGQVIIQNGGLLRGNGRIFSEVRNHGRIAPGESTGKLVAVYEYQQFADGLLEIQLGGYNAGQESDGFDMLEVLAGGGASLAGTLRVELLPGFTPEIGDTFEFLKTEGPIVGGFGALTLVNFPAGLSAIARPGDHSYPSMVIEITPEPGTLVLLWFGVLAVLRRRKRIKNI